MYINPFFAGVLATIGVELALIVTASLIAYLRDGKKRNGEFETEKQRVKADIQKTRCEIQNAPPSAPEEFL